MKLMILGRVLFCGVLIDFEQDLMTDETQVHCHTQLPLFLLFSSLFPWFLIFISAPNFSFRFFFSSSYCPPDGPNVFFYLIFKAPFNTGVHFTPISKKTLKH